MLTQLSNGCGLPMLRTQHRAYIKNLPGKFAVAADKRAMRPGSKAQAVGVRCCNAAIQQVSKQRILGEKNSRIRAAAVDDAIDAKPLDGRTPARPPLNLDSRSVRHQFKYAPRADLELTARSQRADP